MSIRVEDQIHQHKCTICGTTFYEEGELVFCCDSCTKEITDKSQARDDLELGRALRWAFNTELYIPLIGFIRKQMIQFLLYHYSHRGK